MKPIKENYQLPSGLKIGERFSLAFDDPSLAQTRHQGRLQDLTPEGFLCIDAPAELRPPRGTPVTISSLRENADTYSFASEVSGRRRLNGRLPVLLVKPPAQIERQQRRSAFRVAVTLRTQVEWADAENPGDLIQKPGIMTDLSGNGAQIFLRQLPSAEIVRLSLNPPDAFIEEAARRQVSRKGPPAKRPFICRDPLVQARERIRSALDSIEARIMRTRIHTEDGRGPIYALSIAFFKPQENCYRLVCYLERQAVQKGVYHPDQPLATAA